MNINKLVDVLANGCYGLLTLNFLWGLFCVVLLGLFGPVLGMMAAFGRLGTGEKVVASQIAAEISVALICTAMGLATAIPFNYILASLSIRLRMLQESLSFGLSSFLEHCKSMQAKTSVGRAGAWK